MSLPNWAEDVKVPMNETLERQDRHDRLEVADVQRAASADLRSAVARAWAFRKDDAKYVPHCRERNIYCPHKPGCKL
jgi:hypothetical protein